MWSYFCIKTLIYEQISPEVLFSWNTIYLGQGTLCKVDIASFLTTFLHLALLTTFDGLFRTILIIPYNYIFTIRNFIFRRSCYILRKGTSFHPSPLPYLLITILSSLPQILHQLLLRHSILSNRAIWAYFYGLIFLQAHDLRR